MATLTVLAGMPCAGKSTYAARYHDPRSVIAYDVIAELLHGSKRQDYGEDVQRLYVAIIRTRCRLGADTVVDATNLRPHERLVWRMMAETYGMDCELVVHPVPLAAALWRNADRECPLPVEQITACWSQQNEMLCSIKSEGFERVSYAPTDP